MKSLFDGKEIYSWCEDLFPICRSVAGPGNLATLKYLKNKAPDIEIKGFKSGEKVFDWEVPREWHIEEAWIKDQAGNEIVNFKNNNLHVMNYSDSVNEFITYDELIKHLYSIPSRPNAIPYVTSYYSRDWGFCIQESSKNLLKKDIKYHVYIDSEFIDGEMVFGEAFIQGESNKEILLSTYICHPSMANNELSGPVVTTALLKKITNESNHYSFRFLFLPETIGSIAYISSNLLQLQKNVIAGYVITCVGDNNIFSFLPSRAGQTISDRAARHLLRNDAKSFKEYKWIHRGSDERQFCAPGVDLPIASIMRSKYGEYDEYHTSDDDLDFISADGLAGSANLIYQTIKAIDKNCYPKVNFLCEPMLSKRGLYPEKSTADTQGIVQVMMDFISYSDGKRDLFEIADLIDQPIWNLYDLLYSLKDKEIIETNFL